MPGLLSRTFCCLAVAMSGALPALAVEPGQIVKAPMPGGGPTVEIVFKPQGKIHLAVGLRPVEGKVAVCGVWTQVGRQSPYITSSGFMKRSLDVSSVQYNNRALIRGPRFATEVSEDDFQAGVRASCEVTRFGWDEKYFSDKVRIRVPRVRSSF